MVAFYTPIFRCTSERTLSIWGSGDWKDYVDGLIFLSIVGIKLELTLRNALISFSLACLCIVVSSSTNLNAVFSSYNPSKCSRPSNWRKKRIHFHDFMLNVHSRLQV